jgi:hypothetical protein
MVMVGRVTEQMLLPQRLIDRLPDPERRGLGLLIGVLSDSDCFEIDNYCIHSMYHDLRVSLDVRETVERRLGYGNRHLACSVQNHHGEICVLVPGNTPATDDCISFLMVPKFGWRDDMLPESLAETLRRIRRKTAEQIQEERRREVKRIQDERDKLLRRAQGRMRAGDYDAAIEIWKSLGVAGEIERAKSLRADAKKRHDALHDAQKEDWEWILGHFTLDKGKQITESAPRWSF